MTRTKFAIYYMVLFFGAVVFAQGVGAIMVGLGLDANEDGNVFFAVKAVMRILFGIMLFVLLKKRLVYTNYHVGWDAIILCTLVCVIPFIAWGVLAAGLIQLKDDEKPLLFGKNSYALSLFRKNTTL